MIAIYARQSVEKDGSVSVQTQIQQCRCHCNFEEEVVEFIDVGYSGGTMKRPALQELLEKVNNQQISSVMVYRLDRISRSIGDFSRLMELFNAKKVRFISCTEWFDTTSPMGRAMLSIAATFAQLERETISQRVADVYRAKARIGAYMGGQIPLGYFLDSLKHCYVVEESEAEIVKLIYARYLEKKESYRTISDKLNAEGYQTKRKNPFSPARIGEILRNPCYVKGDRQFISYAKNFGYEMILFPGSEDGCGYYLYGKKQKNQVIISAPHKGIISSEIWINAQKKRQERFGEALRITQDCLNPKNYYAYNPEFDK